MARQDISDVNLRISGVDKVVRTKSDDATEQRVIDDVHRVGWHVVGIEDHFEGPAFAYSIGMQHTLNHPEVIVLGLRDVAAMMNIINAIGEEVRKGSRFQDWHESDQILEGYSCIFRSVPTEVFPEYFGFAMWFYRPDSFQVLQCVWPDSQRQFPWQAGCHSVVRQRQPLLTHQSGWPFSEGKNRAVFTTNRVLDGSHPVLHICHDRDGDWQFLCGTSTSPADGRIATLEEILHRHPSIAALANLPAGSQATRDSACSPWRRA